VRKVLADGTVREYRYRRGERKRFHVVRQHGAIRMLAVAYTKSPEFAALSAAWQHARRYYLGLLEDTLDWMNIDDLNSRKSRAEFYEIRDELATTPHKADKLIDTLKALLAWGYERNKLDFNHALGIPHLGASGKVRNDIVWTEDHEAIVYTCFPPSLAQAFRFALFSGMRQSDMCALRWSQYRDGWITYQPSKTRGSTGLVVNLPVVDLRPFRELIDGMSRSTEFMLTTETGHPLEAINLRARWRVALAKTDLAGDDLHWHDIRGTTITRLYEAGCTDAEVASISGHAIGGGSKLGDYAARSKQLAVNAYRKWNNHLAERPEVLAFGNRPGNRGN
jgi:integrase